MSAPPNETLRDLVNLLRASDDDSAREPPGRRQDVGGPYRSERETLEAQVQDELERLEHEQVLLNERRALITAVRRASRPETFPRRFARTLAFGAFLGTATSITTLFVMIAPMLGPDSRVSLRPPSEWHVPTAPTPPPAAPPRITMPEGVTYHLCNDEDRLTLLHRADAPHTLGSGITQITEVVWDVDRHRIVHDVLNASDSLRIVNDERLGVRVYGIRRASPAGQLGLQNGDELIAVDGVLVRDLLARTNTRGAVERLVRELTDHSRIELSLVRHGEPMTFTYLLR